MLSSKSSTYLEKSSFFYSIEKKSPKNYVNQLSISIQLSKLKIIKITNIPWTYSNLISMKLILEIIDSILLCIISNFLSKKSKMKNSTINYLLIMKKILNKIINLIIKIKIIINQIIIFKIITIVIQKLLNLF